MNIHVCLLLILVVAVIRPGFAAEALSKPADDIRLYDSQLCVTAQRMILNAQAAELFEIEVLYGESNGFHVIQMNAEPGKITIATTSGVVEVDGRNLKTYVGCKMVNRDRVNDVLELNLEANGATCRTVNEATYRQALERMTAVERERYEAAGRKLIFTDDYITAGGAEWLPAVIDDFIVADADGLKVTAPAVDVPWDPVTREFYQGTRHCKLITLAAMERWVRQAAFTDTTELFPRAVEECGAPNSLTSKAGSCLFWFAPAGSMFCQDYSGRDWDETSARAECSKRHASAEALAVAASRYEGTGGIYDRLSCDARTDSDAPSGTCVFHCRAGDETLWHTPADDAGGPAGNAMMQRACDLYLER